MLKRILIGVAVLVIILIAAIFYLNYRNRTLSPGAKAELTANGLTSVIHYSSPSVRERIIFGKKEDEAVQPYGKYWRMGANESTEITFDNEVIINGQNLKAGTYKLYAIPQEFEFEIGVSTELGTWGYAEPDYTKEVMRLTAPVERITPPSEQLVYKFEKARRGMNLIMEFETVRLTIPIELAAPRF